MESKAGQAYLATKSPTVFVVPSHTVVYFPIGVYAMPWYYSPKAKNDKSVAKWAHSFHVPILRPGVVDQISEKLFKAVRSTNVDFMTTRTEIMWRDRLQLFQTFFKQSA